MTIQRRTQFGFPSDRPPPSAVTVRMVPLTQGQMAHDPVTNLPAGSATSLLNFVPYNGYLAPRSRYSSLKTLPLTGTPGAGSAIYGMTETVHVQSSVNDRPLVWIVAAGSASTDNLNIQASTGGVISRASFVSAGGFGTKPSWVLGASRPGFAFYPSVFNTNIADNLVVIALPKALGSEDTVLVAGVDAGTTATYSYLTQAPPARFVAAYDNYLLAWNTREGGVLQPRRIRWSDRGDPGNWTPGGFTTAGFEDLLSMKGTGNGITTLDNRLILFSTREIWVGLPSTYPSQFQFYPLDTTIGCQEGAAATIVETEMGIVFLGHDSNLRLLPRGGGLSQIVNPDIGTYLRERSMGMLGGPWTVYDAERRLYYLYPFLTGTISNGIVVNLNTGEWGETDTVLNLASGCFAASAGGEKLRLGGVLGEVYSTDSTPAGDKYFSSSFTVTSTFQSIPVGQDLPEGHRQLTGLLLAYKATSATSGGVAASGNFGNTFGAESGVTLPAAKRGGVVDIDVMADGPAPVVQWSSTKTGYQLHRLSATFNLRGSV